MSPVRRLAPDIVAAGAKWRPLAPFAGLFALLIVFAVGGMLVIAHEADRSDAARAREAVTRTFYAILGRLDLAAELNAAAPPVATSLSGPLATPASVYGYLNFLSSRAMGYYGSVVLNRDGTAFAGTRFGLPWTGATLDAAARLIAPVAARLPASGAGGVHRLVRDADGRVMAIAVVNVASDGPARAGGPPAPERRLAMIAPVVTQLVPNMLPSLGVEDFRVIAAPAGDTSVAMPVEHGPPLVFAWRPRTPGRAAIARWAPAFGALLVTALVLLAAIGRSSIATLDALERLARRDYLTGLANRSAFSDELNRRQARGETVALGMIDLNGFKDVNDEHGHLTGDRLLQAVAVELAGSAGPGDFVARLGGDEFAWISPSHAAADRLSEEFAARIAAPLTVGPLRLQVGTAIGIALAGPGTTASSLMAMADALLYESKRASRRSEHRRRPAGDAISRRRAPRRDPRPAPEDRDPDASPPDPDEPASRAA